MVEIEKKPADGSNGKKGPIIECENVKRSFVVGESNTPALQGINLKIYPKEYLVIFGPSGCGKTTLLNIILGIDIPTAGKVFVRGQEIFKMDEDKRADFRAHHFGMVHQMSYWVRSLNVAENVALPLLIKNEEEDSMGRAGKVLGELGIGDLVDKLPYQLSSGEQQKIGVARALVTNPLIIMADEPTGNLDSESAQSLMDLFKKLNQEHDRTIILVTHNEEYWDCGTRRIEMRDGMITKEISHG